MMFFYFYICLVSNVLQWACFTFYIRKRLKENITPKERCLCVEWTRHSVLLRHVGGFRGPPGTKPGPLLTASSHPRLLLSVLICSLLSLWLQHWETRTPPGSLGLPGWPGSHPDCGPGLHGTCHRKSCPYAQRHYMPAQVILCHCSTFNYGGPGSKDQRSFIDCVGANRWCREWLSPVVKLVFKATETSHFLIISFIWSMTIINSY